MQHVQAFLINTSFPDSFVSLCHLMENSYQYKTAIYETHLDIILQASQEPNGSVNWSAPRWAMPGDIVFFYHAGKAIHYINQLLKNLEDYSGDLSQSTEDMFDYLEYAKKQAKQYGSCIFATGQVCSEIQKSSHNDPDSHFKGRIYVDIENICLLEKPVKSNVFNTAIRIGQNTITPVCGSDFASLKLILEKETSLPVYLQEASSLDRGFYNFDPKEWWLTASDPQTRFLHETQLRIYFADALLSVLKDRKSPLLEECRTFKDGKSTGYADYMIQILGMWIPVETKLNILTEKDLFGQLKKYQNIDSFTVTKGAHKDLSIETEAHGLCILIDHKGIYLVIDNQWLHSEERKPWILRTDINPEKCQHMQAELIDIVKKLKGQKI